MESVPIIPKLVCHVLLAIHLVFHPIVLLLVLCLQYIMYFNTILSMYKVFQVSTLTIVDVFCGTFSQLHYLL